MTTAAKYIFGDPKVPTWVGDAMSDISYSTDGKLIRANISTANGVKSAKQGDVLMRINETVVLLGQRDAKKYRVTK